MTLPPPEARGVLASIRLVDRRGPCPSAGCPRSTWLLWERPIVIEVQCAPRFGWSIVERAEGLSGRQTRWRPTAQMALAYANKLAFRRLATGNYNYEWKID